MKNKNTISIIIIGVLVISFGIVRGVHEYKETAMDPASQNVGSGEKCIITIQGGQYDVTQFRSKHEGGDIFKCGEDMTQSFQGKHKGYLPMIAKFKVN